MHKRIKDMQKLMDKMKKQIQCQRAEIFELKNESLTYKEQYLLLKEQSKKQTVNFDNCHFVITEDAISDDIKHLFIID